MDDSTFMAKEVRNHDLIEVEMLQRGRAWFDLRARICKIYTARKGISMDMLGHRLEFISRPGGWGMETLQLGEQALLFVHYDESRKKFYEPVGYGHMVIKPVEGTKCALFPREGLSRKRDLPDNIRSAILPVFTSANSTPVKFEVMENYLIDLIKQVDGDISIASAPADMEAQLTFPPKPEKVGFWKKLLGKT